MKTDRKPEEIAAIIDAQAREDAGDAIAAMSDEELDAELRAAGVDPEKELEEMHRLLDEQARTQAAAVAPPLRVVDGTGARKPPRRWMGARTKAALWVALPAAAAAAALAGGTWEVLVARRDRPPPAPSHESVPAPPPDTALAAAARKDAFAACGRGEWTGCLTKLDEARRLDPAGDTDPRVLAARHQIEAAHAPDNDLAKPGPAWQPPRPSPSTKP